MFIRAIWRFKRMLNVPQHLREMQAPGNRDFDALGQTGADFTQMTKGLFDR